MTNEGTKALLSDWYITLHYLLKELYDWRKEAEDDRHDEELAKSLTASWLKVEKYYKLVDETPMYYAAIVLNPMYKMVWFHENWTSEEELP